MSIGNDACSRGNWLAPTLLAVGLITAARIALLIFNRTDLFVDEAQYWLWGQDLALGYYSKPPMIGWVIRAATELGSDAPFWVRLPAPLFHGATALVLGAIAARAFGPRTALITALAYATLPMVAVGSLLISTDTIMFPFLAAALAGYLRLLDRREAWVAMGTGAALGLAFLSKYAAIYYLICAALTAIAIPSARIDWRTAGVALAAFLATASPNLVWNLANGLATVQHTLDNADWVRDPAARAGLNASGLAEFLASQFAVFGPIPFATLLCAAAIWRRCDPEQRLLLLFALPIIAMVSVQALLAHAYANWAAAAYLAGTLLVVPLLLAKRIWLIASFAINGALSLALPLATTAADTFTLGRDEPLLARYLGRAEMSQAILRVAEAENIGGVVAGDRDVLADLFYSARAHSVEIYAMPPDGRAPHHYALQFPYPGGMDDILIVVRANNPAPCPEAVRISEIAPETGAYRRHPQFAYRAPGDCLSASIPGAGGN